MNNLNRFIEAQEKDYELAILEIKSGYKRSHWMWYIFPQLSDLGYSSIAKYYGIKDIEEAKAYLNNDYLRNNLINISNELYKLNNSIENILGYPDYLKLNSCMTLFNYVDPSINIFNDIINKFYDGKKDEITLNILNGDKKTRLF
jgi:uncharacterized protein (DUF1810 family)